MDLVFTRRQRRHLNQHLPLPIPSAPSAPPPPPSTTAAATCQTPNTTAAARSTFLPPASAARLALRVAAAPAPPPATASSQKAKRNDAHVKKKELLPTYFCFWKPSKRCSAGCVGRGGGHVLQQQPLLLLFSPPPPHFPRTEQAKILRSLHSWVAMDLREQFDLHNLTKHNACELFTFDGRHRAVKNKCDLEKSITLTFAKLSNHFTNFPPS